MNGLELVRGFIARGYTPSQAAALAGHALQESGGNPASVNPQEDAHGILQFRGSRWQGLQDYAKSQGKDPTDPNIQMDYVKREMSGPEAKSSAGFMAAPDVASASAALKPYIRFGDDSAGKRQENAMNLYQQYAGAPAPVGALAQPPVDPTSPIDPTQSVGAPGAPLSLAAPAPQVGALANAATALKGIGAATAPPATPGGQPAAPDFIPPQQIAMGQPSNGQSQALAMALAQHYGIS